MAHHSPAPGSQDAGPCATVVGLDQQMKYACKAATDNTQQENDSRGRAVRHCFQGVVWGKKLHGAGQHSGVV